MYRCRSHVRTLFYVTSRIRTRRKYTSYGNTDKRTPTRPNTLSRSRMDRFYEEIGSSPSPTGERRLYAEYDWNSSNVERARWFLNNELRHNFFHVLVDGAYNVYGKNWFFGSWLIFSCFHRVWHVPFFSIANFLVPSLAWIPLKKRCRSQRRVFFYSSLLRTRNVRKTMRGIATYD